MNPKKIINFYSLRRSGQHAIIFWYLFKYNLNLVPLNSNLSHYFSYHYCSEDKETLFFINDQTHPDQWKQVLKSCKIKPENPILIRNFEDQFVNFETRGENIVIVRDLINLISSRKKLLENIIEQPRLRPTQLQHKIYTQEEIERIRASFTKEIPSLIQKWKSHVGFLTRKNLPINVVVYNKWLLSKDYRKDISLKLNMPENIDITSYIPRTGDCSSFIGQTLEKEKANYLKRHKLVNLPNDIKEIIINDKFLIDLHQEHFDLNLKNI